MQTFAPMIFAFTLLVATVAAAVTPMAGSAAVAQPVSAHAVAAH